MEGKVQTFLPITGRRRLKPDGGGKLKQLTDRMVGTGLEQ